MRISGKGGEGRVFLTVLLDGLGLRAGKGVELAPGVGDGHVEGGGVCARRAARRGEDAVRSVGDVLDSDERGEEGV